MKNYTLIASALATAIFAGGNAYADCAQDLAALEAGSHSRDGIAKDGTLAPLETNDASSGADAADMDEPQAAEGISKDGSLAPLEDAADASSDQAMSGQDAQAQQEGEPTAAEAAGGADATTDGGRSAAIEKARTALAAGDEDACRAALDELRKM